MLIRRPVYFEAFACLAGECPDTCCAAWDVVVDGASLARYKALPGPFGERVRAALTVDGDGDTCFQTRDGVCPLLTPDRLCAVQLELGEEAVCAVCRAHPRFIEEYGPLREESLACSCPEAVRLMLSSPAEFPTEETGEAATDCADVDLPLLNALLPCRERAFGLLRGDGEPAAPVGVRLSRLLDYAWALQDRLDEGDAAGLAQVPVPPAAEVRAEGGGVVETLLNALRGLEILSPEWRKLLDEAVGPAPALSPSAGAEYGRFAAYLTYRWFLKADFDGDVYAKAAFTAFGYLTVRALEGRADRATLVRLWCKEQEHCEENMDALAALCWDEPGLSRERLKAALCL